VASFYVMGGASLSFGLVGSLTGRIRIGWDLEGWIWVSLIALVATALAATAFLQGLKLVGPSRASILSLVEPLTSSSVKGWRLTHTPGCHGGGPIHKREALAAPSLGIPP